ncbi:MAG: oligosaccharide flippase family protein [Candidatus Acidiferrales bacterium]
MIQYAKSLIERVKSSILARNSVWMFMGYGVRIFVQAGYFVLIARALGPHEYGAFVGATALISIVAPFAGVGSGNLLVKNVSRDKSLFAIYWGNALFMLGVSGLVLLGIVVLVAHLVLPAAISLLLVVVICLSDLIGARITDIAAQAFQAMEQLAYTANFSLLPYLLRMISAAIVFALWHHATAMIWGWFYLGSTAVSCIIAVSITTWKLGAPKPCLSRIPPELREGFYFGAGLSAQTIYNDIDKTMLASLSTLDATGIYAAAYRVIDVSFTPVKSVLYAAYSNFFRSGARGIAPSYAYAKKLLPRTIAYSILAFAGLYVFAPLFPLIIGKEFARTVEALRWLALLPLLKTVHYFLADAMTGAGYQGIRAAAQVSVALTNVGLNLWLIPRYSWRGAAWSSIACDGLLAVSLYVALRIVLRRSQRETGQKRNEAYALAD